MSGRRGDESDRSWKGRLILSVYVKVDFKNLQPWTSCVGNFPAPLFAAGNTNSVDRGHY